MIIFADAAALKVKEILELDPDYNSEMDTNLNLRVLISGGGCSGFNMVSLWMKRKRMAMW